MILEVLVGKAAKRPAESKLRAQIEALDIVYIKVEANDVLAGGQAVFKANEALVRTIANVAMGALDLQEHGLALSVDLEIRGTFDPIVVGDDQLELDFADLLKRGDLVIGLLTEVAGNIVGQLQRLRPIGLDDAGAPHTTARRRHDFGVINPVDDNALGKKLSTAYAVFGRIVREPQDDRLDVAAILGFGQHAFERVVAQLATRGEVGNVEISKAQLGEIPELHLRVRAEEIRHVAQDLAE